MLSDVPSALRKDRRCRVAVMDNLGFGMACLTLATMAIPCLFFLPQSLFALPFVALVAYVLSRDDGFYMHHRTFIVSVGLVMLAVGLVIGGSLIALFIDAEGFLALFMGRDGAREYLDSPDAFGFTMAVLFLPTVGACLTALADATTLFIRLRQSREH